MKQCLGQGELRAWVDRELPPERALAVEQHLAECAGCAVAYEAISARAARVSGWMAALSADVPMPVAAPRKAILPRTVWVGVAALAAGLLLAAALSRQPGKRPVQATVAVPPAPVVVQETPLVAAMVAPAPAPVARVRRRPVRPARTSPVQYYMALDEEPIDTGLVMRVALPSGLQADVIVDGDGRARAIRPISVMKEEQ